jgi:mannose-6-phosphate isomerase-like protein (cupin superfamily)
METEMGAAVIDGPDNSETQAWWFLDTLVVEHRRAPEMDSIVLEMTLPVGHAPPLHVHDTLDDTWYLLEGRMAARCGDDEYVVEAGTWVSMPRGVPHAFRVIGDRPARILVVHDHAAFRDFVRELGTPTDELVPPPIPSFPSMEELGRAAGAHDLRPIGPPMTPDEASAITTRVGEPRQAAPA